MDQCPPWLAADEFLAARSDPYRAFDVAQQRILQWQQQVALRQKTNAALQSNPKYEYSRAAQNYERLKAEHETLNAAFRELTSTQTSLSEVVDVLRGDKRELLVQLNTAKRELLIQRVETEQLEVEAEKARGQLAFADEKIKGQEQQLSLLDDSEKAARKKVADLRAEVGSLEASCQSLTLQAKSLSGLREHLEGTHRAQAGAIQSLEREVQEKEKGVVEHSRQLWEFKRDMSARILALQKTAQERQDELDQLRRLSEHEVETLAAQNKALNDELKKTSDALFRARKERSDFSTASRAEMSEKTEDIKRYAAIVDLVGKQNDGLEAAVKRLEEQNRLAKRQISEKDNVNHKNVIEQANFISLVHMELQSTTEDLAVLKARLCHMCRSAASTPTDEEGDEPGRSGAPAARNTPEAMEQLGPVPSYPGLQDVGGAPTGPSPAEQEMQRMRDALEALNRQLLEERVAREREREVEQSRLDEQAFDRDRRKAEEAERQRRAAEDEKKTKSGEQAHAFTVLLVDGSRRVVDGFSSDTVRDMIARVCMKIGVRQREAFYLAHVVNESSISGPVDRFLDKSKTLEAEGITPRTTLVMKFKHVKRQRDWSDPVAQEWFFRQLHQQVISEYTPVSESVAVKLAAFELQAVFSDYTAQKRNRYFERVGLDAYLPTSVSAHEYDYWQERLAVAHKKCHGLSADRSRSGYVNLLATTPFWGMTFFDVRDRDNRPFLAAVSEDGLHIFSANKKELLSVVSFADLLGWERAPSGVQVRRRGSNKMTLYATSKLQSKEMVDLLNEYYLLLPPSVRDTLQVPIANEDVIRGKLPSPAMFIHPVTSRPAPSAYGSRLEYLKAAYMATCLEADEQGRQHQPITKLTRLIDAAIDAEAVLEVLDLSHCMPPLDDYQFAITTDLFHYTMEEYQPPAHSTAPWREDIAIQTLSLAQEPTSQLLSAVSIDRVARFIAKFPALRSLDLSYISLENTVRGVGEALCTLTELEELKLNGCRLGAQALQPVLLVFGVQPSKLTTLSLEHNFLTHAAIHPLAEIIKSGRTALRNVNLAFNRLEPTGIDLIVAALTATRRIVALDVSGNPGVQGQSTRVGDLLSSRTGLNEVVLRSCDLQGSSRVALTTELTANPDLRALNISQNPLGVQWPTDDASVEDDAFKFLVTASSDRVHGSVSALQILEMEQCMLGTAASAALGRALHRNNTVHTLNVGHNDLARSTGFLPPVWVDMLGVNATLTTVDLSDNGLTYAGAMKLFAALIRNRTLVSLKLSHNDLSKSPPVALTEAHGELVAFLEQSQSLKELWMAGCDMRDDLVIKIGEGLRRNRCLTSLHAPSNTISIKAVVELARLLAENRTLNLLDLTCDSVRTDETVYIEAYKMLSEAGRLETVLL